jgi:DNA-binding LytR/AlgR family response regulator
MVFALSNLNRVTKNLSSLLMISGTVFLVVITLAFFLALFQSPDYQLGVEAFFSALLTVFSFAVLPIFLFILIAERIMLTKHVKLAQNVSEKLQTADKKDDCRLLTLIAENEKDKVEIYINELLYIEASDNYSSVYFKKHGEVKKQLLRGSLKRMEDQLKSCELVVRCHKSFIVNVSKISKVSGNAQGYKLHIPEIDTEIPVSRKFPKSILDKIA